MKKVFYCVGAFLLTASLVSAQTKPAPKPAAPVMKNLIDSFSYAAGMNIANNMKEQGITQVNSALMAKGINDVMTGQNITMSKEDANNCLQKQMTVFGSKKGEEEKKKAAVEVAKGNAYLEVNKKKPGIVTLGSGLQYEVIKAGDPNATKPTLQDTVVVDYTGKLIDGTEFDSSTKNGGPITFPVSGVIKGWTEALQLMSPGSVWKVYIPNNLAYGERPAGAAIPAGAALIFDISLLDVKPVAKQ